jgi:hypothetical protein
MNSPLTFDMIVGLAFAFAIVVGTLAGLLKLILMLLALAAPFLALMLIFVTSGTNPLDSLPPQSMQYASVLIAATTVSLVISVIWLVPGPRTVAGRASGVLFAGVLATLAVGAMSVTATQINPALEDVLRTKSLTGPAALAVGNAMISVLPDNPENLLKRERPKL